MKNPSSIPSQLRAMTSADAATLLMKTFPVGSAGYSEAFRLMSHRSWKRPDQIRLARFYLQKMPFASEKPYAVFSSFMAIPSLVHVMRELIPQKKEDRQLVHYHLIPVLKKHVRSEKGRSAVRSLSNELSPPA